MTTNTTVLPMDEFRAIWVYGMNVPDADWGALLAQTEDPDTGVIRRPLAEALALSSIDQDFIDFLVNDELEALSLSGLLIGAHGMDANSVAPDAAKLDQLRGQVLLVHSSALGTTAPSVEPRPPLTFIGRYHEDMKMDATAMAPAKSVIPTPPVEDDAPPAKKKPSDAAMSGRVATVALLVMALLVWVIIRIAA